MRCKTVCARVHRKKKCIYNYQCEFSVTDVNPLPTDFCSGTSLPHSITVTSMGLPSEEKHLYCG